MSSPVFLFPPSSSCARGACVIFFNVTVLTGCAWEPRCVTLMTKVYVNASPAQSALYPSSSSVCLLVCQSAHTHWLAPSAVALHLILIHRARFQCTLMTWRVRVSPPSLAVDHSRHTQNEKCRKLLAKAGARCLKKFFFPPKRVQLTVISGLLDLSLLIWTLIVVVSFNDLN